MRRALAKPHPRVVGVDDGAFTRRERYAPIAAVRLVLPNYVEQVGLARVRVDGTDGTDRIVELLHRTGGLEGIHAVLLDGAAVGGFNVIDLRRLYAETGVPVVAVTPRRPDFERIKAALVQYFDDAQRRWKTLTAVRLWRVATDGRPLWVAAVGTTRQDASGLVRRAIVRGRWPEPLRLAHKFATAVGRPLPQRPANPGASTPAG